jgi:hypothetical protein
MNSVKRLCKKAILLHQGNLLYEGLPIDVANLYSKLLTDKGTLEGIEKEIAEIKQKKASSPAEPVKTENAPPPPPDREETLAQDEKRVIQISGKEFSYGGELAKVRLIQIKPAGENSLRTVYQSGEAVEIHVEIEAFDYFQEPIYTFTLKDKNGVAVYGTNSLAQKMPIAPLKSGDVIKIKFAFNLDVMPGTYFISNSITQFVGEKLIVGHRRYDAVKIDVLGVDRSFGIANLHAKITTTPFPAA